MPIIPTIAPGASSTRSRVSHSWPRTRRLLLLDFLWLPALVVMCCVVMLGTGVVLANTSAVWAGCVLVAVLALPLIQLRWLTTNGLTNPPMWLPISFLTGGGQLLTGVIPSLAITGGSVLPSAMFSLFTGSWLVIFTSWFCAYRAHATITSTVDVETGATPFHVGFPARSTCPGNLLVTSNLLIAPEHMSWSGKKHRGRGSKHAYHEISFTDLRAARSVTLPPGPAQPWLTLSDGTTLYAEPGPAIVLEASHGQYMIPVHDPALVSGLLNRRLAHWRASAR